MDPNKAGVHDKQNALGHHIANWRKIQTLYMPCASLVLESKHKIPSPQLVSSESPETVPLCLPSGVPAHMCDLGCAKGLVEKEKRLHVAQAQDALYQIWQAF